MNTYVCVCVCVCVCVGGVWLSICSPVRVSDRVRTISPEPLTHFWPNLLWWCIVIKRCVMMKNCSTIFKVKVTPRAYTIIIWLFILYILSYMSVCEQTWFDRTTSLSGVFSGKFGLLRSRLRSKRRFKLLINVSLDDIFWTTEHFVTKLGMVMQHYKPGYTAEKLVDCLQCQGHIEGLFNQNMTILLSPTLFNVFLERITTDALEDHEGTVSIGGRTITISALLMTSMA